MTPLMLAAHRGHATVIRHLLNKGANSRARQSEHNPKTALIYAVERGNVNSVRALLIHSNLNVQGGNGRSALTTAANLRKPNIVQMLIRAGARPNAMTLGYIMNNSALRNSIGGMFVRRALAKKAVRAAMTTRMKNRNFSMREQLSGVNVETGLTRVKGLPSGVRNLIGTMMRGRRQ
jgi:non-canonical (house-cleaning) NTP pyrophosphatase